MKDEIITMKNVSCEIRYGTEFGYVCPKCKSSDFSVRVIAYQSWDSKNDEWFEIEEIEEVDKGEEVFFCRSCESVFDNEEMLKVVRKDEK